MRISKVILLILGCLVGLYLLVILTLNQSLHAFNRDNTNVNLQQLEQSSVTPLVNHWASLLLNYQVVSDNQDTYAVISKNGNQIRVVSIDDIINNMMLFSNLPLLLLGLFTITVPIYINRRHQKTTIRSLEVLNDETNRLLASFNISLPKIEQQNVISKLSFALVELNKQINEQHHKTFISQSQDKLTGLIDRHAYLHHLQTQLEQAQKLNKRQALLFIDLDGFKQVNDSFGHSFGDEVLVQVAQRLKTVVRNQNLSHFAPTLGLELSLSRLGGDEFSIFIENLEDENLPIEVAKNVLQEIEGDFLLGNKLIKIGASIGIAVYPDSAANPNTLLQMADVAMYRAKTDGRGIYRVYSPEMGNKMRRYHYLLEEIRLAMASQNFTLSFQPIVNVNDFSIDYFECLIRWNHPIEGSISPAEFIPIAEDSNLILELGNWILLEACRQMAAWYNAGMNKVRISVNISGVQLAHIPLHDWVMNTLNKVGLPAKALLLEITESCFIDASEQVISDLEKLRQAGVLIAIDDFGTGFSSLSTLANLPVDVIKIDKLFIDQANINPKYEKILNSISGLGKTLDLKIVAEGVETAAQFELVKKMGIDCIQGYLISRPETSKDVGSKMISQNINHIAMTGTGVYAPQTSEAPLAHVQLR
ncbi:putative bifunctional diguanylate cyclase/phosphodiesterase [Shewanella livingstonensis]|uniref:EAL domain-containing protein n=1 Tax=Shewanella livingstonensis TaxID=150120 RepID=A0A3G8LWH3_9GAMM|nr:EAL domain-containing protein [Shewanella livingstonensis]AZG74006.1 EAL domain-containing protein [Shewanella livingstonensis]